MKRRLHLLNGLASTVSTLVGYLVIFPKIDNRELFQAKLGSFGLTIFLIIVTYILFTFISKKIGDRRKWLFTLIGSLAAISFLVFLFGEYYPYLNKKLLRLNTECGGDFIRGDSINISKLTPNSSYNYDSLSKVDPSYLVQNTNCDPAIAWTLESIEHNFNGLVIRFCCLVFTFSISIFFLIKGVYKTS